MLTNKSEGIETHIKSEIESIEQVDLWGMTKYMVCAFRVFGNHAEWFQYFNSTW